MKQEKPVAVSPKLSMCLLHCHTTPVHKMKTLWISSVCNRPILVAMVAIESTQRVIAEALNLQRDSDSDDR